MKTGLFFGSYNPIHNGHIAIAKYILSHSDLDEIWFVVSPQNPWKKTHSQPHSSLRLKMVELAIANEPNLKATNFEEKLPKPSYTFEALQYLKQNFTAKEFVLIIGGDNYKAFYDWRNAKQILANFSVWAYPRKGENIRVEDKQIKLVDAPLINISSTEVRSNIQEKNQFQTWFTKMF